MEENNQIQLALGALGPHLSEQLENFYFDVSDIEHLEKDRQAINRLRIGGYLMASAVASVEKKLLKKILGSLETEEG